MDTSAPYLLHSISVVVTAEHHDPSILSPLFLESNRIVPGDWKVVKSETATLSSSVQYNQILLKMDASSLEIQEAVEGPFRENYVIHSIADAYISKVPHAPYRNLGLNCTVGIRVANPEQWMQQRFLSSGPWLKGDPDLHTVQTTLAVQADDDLLCLFSFYPGEMKNNQTEESERIVVVTVNIHHQGLLSADSIREAIRRWPKRQSLIRATLEKVLEGP